MSANHQSLTISQQFNNFSNRYKSLKEEQEKAATKEKLQADLEIAAELHSNIKLVLQEIQSTGSTSGIKTRSLSGTTESKLEQMVRDINKLELELNDSLNQFNQAERLEIQERITVLSVYLKSLETLPITEDDWKKLSSIQKELAIKEAMLPRDANPASEELASSITELGKKVGALLTGYQFKLQEECVFRRTRTVIPV